MSDGSVVIGVPSKGRLMERTLDVFADCGFSITKEGDQRGYRGSIAELPGAEVAFLSASEIAYKLKNGSVHIGVTGEDLVREAITDADRVVTFITELGYGHANVVVAAPVCWLDARFVSDLEDIATTFRQIHGRRLRVATKYANLTRRFLSEKGVTGYRIVESLGATEGAPASGAAELIVDITSTGATLKANHLKIFEDGIILQSQANLIASKHADWFARASEIRNEIIEAFSSLIEKQAQTADAAP